MWLSSVRSWLKGASKSTLGGRRPQRACRPGLDMLEDRTVPTTIFNVAAGNVAGLIAALDKANTDSQEDVINLAPGAPYTLRETAPPGGAYGLTVLADGGKLLTVNGNGATITRDAGSPDFGILFVDMGAFVTLSGLTLTNGNNPTSPGGGGISNQGTLTLGNCTLAGNSAALGGGIYVNAGGILRLDKCTVSDNKSVGSGGGLFLSPDSAAVIDNSTISGNQTLGGGSTGGGIFRDSGLFQLVITNSTISGNTAAADGGGIRVFGVGPVGINNSTIAFNTAGGSGGGISVNAGAGRVGLFSTIVADNTASGQPPDISGIVTAINSLVESTAGTVFSGGSNNVTNVDPRLGPLANNGGPTRTHALLAGSPAINAGLTLADQGLDFDQRGPGFARVVGLAADMGAFEVQPPPPAPVARAVVAALVSRKVRKRRLLFVRVSFADTGELKALVRSPFQKPAFRAIAATAFDSDGDGVADAVRLTARKGKKTVRRLLAL